MSAYLGRFRRVPIELFRIQPHQNVMLREFKRQQELGRRSYDFVLGERGLVLPSGDTFKAPNGMSLRPAGRFLGELVADFDGEHIFVIPKDTKIPDHLILLHEHTDHYALQTSVPCTESDLNTALTDFLSNMEEIDKDEFFKRYPLF